MFVMYARTFGSNALCFVTVVFQTQTFLSFDLCMPVAFIYNRKLKDSLDKQFFLETL